ncbi:MAG: SidE phosphodiesterase domain-containing protein [Candidatus Paracaedibacter sp.]
MPQDLIKYLLLSSLTTGILPIGAMDQPIKDGGAPRPAQATHAGSENLIAELIADPFKWNNWLINLINKHFGEQYDDGPQSITRNISGTEFTVPRPNHGLGHGMKQGFLAVNILDGFEYINPNDFTSPGTADFIQWIQMKLKTDPYFRHKIQFTAAFQRTGRQSEADISTQFALVQEYEYKDSENFYNAAKDFVGPHSLFSNEEELILYKQSILKHSKLKDAIIKPDNKELQYLRKVISTSHTLDLRRLTKTEFNEPTVIANATKSLFGPETAFSDPKFKNSHIYPQFKKEGSFIKRLWEYSGKYLQATGDRYDGKFEDKFFIQAKNPDQMVIALLEAEKSLRSLPHPVGIFLYSTCPMKLKAKQPTTDAHEWCTLLIQNKDGSYGPLGSFATPFEDEADVARRGVREESADLYDIDPATFDRDVLSPLDQSEPLPELRLRALNRLQQETPEAHKARLKSFISQGQTHPRDLSGSKGETLQDLKARRAFETLPSSVQAKTGEKVDNTLFFKEVPFYSAKKFLEEGKEHKGIHEGEKASGYAWVPVRHLINLQDETVKFYANDGFFAFLAQDRKQEIANQPVGLKLSPPFAHLLNQPEAKEYLKNKVIAKPIPATITNKIKTHIELKDRGNAAQLNVLNPNAFTMFDKFAQAHLGNKVGDSQSNLAKIIEQHNSNVTDMLQLSAQWPHSATQYLFYQITPDIEKTLFQMVAKENRLYPWFVFYHAVPADIYQVYQMCTQFLSLLTGKNLKNNLILRSLNDPFSIIQNIEDFYQKATEEHSKGGMQTIDKTPIFRKQGMSVNMTLFGGLQEAIGSSQLKAEYSIHRWMAAYSDINNPNIAQEFIAQFLSHFGIPKDRAKRYQDLYKEYFTPSKTVNWKNPDDIKNIMQETDKRTYGVMLQLFINPEIINQVAYLAQAGGGKLILPSEETPQTILMKIRLKSEDSSMFQGIQTRLFLKPKYFHNPKYVKIFPYFSKNLEKPEKEYHEKLKKLVTEDLAFLLSSNAPISKEDGKQPLLELHDRVTGNIREQTDVADQKIFDWFSANQTDAVRAHYDKNPSKANTPLKNIHNLSYGYTEIKTPTKGYMPIQLSLMYKNQELFLYFLEKLNKETEKQFLSKKFPLQTGHTTVRNVIPLEAFGLVEFNLQEVVLKLYEKIGNTLFDSLFLIEDGFRIENIMGVFDSSMNAIPPHYLENLFSKPSYLRGLKYIKKIPLSGDQATSVLNKTFDDLWLAFKMMPFFTGEKLSPEDQRYYNILLKGAEKNYQPMANLFVMNKFTFSYFETFLQAIHFDQFPEKFARNIFASELSDDFTERSLKKFLNLIKVNLPMREKEDWEDSTPNLLLELVDEYTSSKEESLGPNDKLIFRAYYRWLHTIGH